MNSLRRSIWALTVAWLAVSASSNAQELSDYKSVYILPMSNSLDQFLAIRLTGSRVMQVVADPQKADAVLTDRIGAGFEESLDQLYGQKPKTDEKDSFSSPPQRISSGSHGKGTIFLVDRKTRVIVWSVYVKPKNTGQDEMNHVAERIAEKLEKDKKAK